MSSESPSGFKGTEKVEGVERVMEFKNPPDVIRLSKYGKQIGLSREFLGKIGGQQSADFAKFKSTPEEQDQLSVQRAKFQLTLAEAQAVAVAQVDSAQKLITDTVSSRLSTIMMPSPGLTVDLGKVTPVILLAPQDNGPSSTVSYGVGVTAKVNSDHYIAGGILDVSGAPKFLLKYTYRPEGNKFSVSYQGIVDTSKSEDTRLTQNTLSGTLQLPKDVTVFANVDLNVAVNGDGGGFTLENYGAALGVKFGPAFSSVVVSKTPDAVVPGINLGLIL